MDRPWQAFYDEGVPASLDLAARTLTEMFDRTVHDHGTSPATFFRGKRLTYAGLAEQVARFGVGLVDAGLQPGERIIVMLPNLPQFPVAFFGSLSAGLVVVPTNPLYKPRELAHQLGDSGASVVVTLPQLSDTVRTAVVGTDVRLIVVADVADALPLQLRIPYRLKDRGHTSLKVPGVATKSWHQIMARAEITRLHRAEPDDLAVLQYTGGTTGVPKAAMLSHLNLVSNATQVHLWQGRSSGPMRTLCAAPFFHVYGLTVGMNMTVLGHGLMILMPRFDAATARATIRDQKPNLFPGVPTMYIGLNGHEKRRRGDFDSLEVCISGASALPSVVQEQFARIAPTAALVEGFGLTEASPVTHCNPVHHPRNGSVGVPFPDTDAAVVPTGGWEPLPPGEVGELIVRGPQVMQGYWKRPDETERVLKNGWLRTGDLGYRDEDGFFYIVDRIKDVIIAGGYNVYPREVEEVLFRHPAVLEACVVGFQSEYRGETVKAFVVVKPAVETTEGALIAFCRDEIAAYKVPTMVEFVDELPKSLVGKVLRRKLREVEMDSETSTDTGQTAVHAGPRAGG